MGRRRLSDASRRTEIPLEGRILAVADAFDAMTCERPYRHAFAFEDALAEVERCAGSQFDPDVASALLAAADADELCQLAAA